MKKYKAEIGVFGGSGFYRLMNDFEEIGINTPYGLPSDKIALGQIAGRDIAFLPRHGKDHKYPPHKVPYQANIYALKELGVKQIIAPCAAGSLQTRIKPGDFVILDQFIDRTSNRKDTFYDGPETTHISFADPYCSVLSDITFKSAQKLKIPVHKKSTVVVVNGPRFSTKAESNWFTKMGWEVINMTQYPENVLARELEICYCGIALITDYDAGLVSMKNIPPVTLSEVINVFNQNNHLAQKLIFEMISHLPLKRNCYCCKALEGARIK